MSRTHKKPIEPEVAAAGPPTPQAAATPEPLPAELFLRLYRAMRLCRLVDQKCMNLQRQGRIHFYGPTTGQEASAIGSGAAFGPGDWIFPALREAGVALLRGLPLRTFMLQLFGRDEEVSRGRQMPCHFTDREHHFVSMSSVVGTQLPHAVGVAFAARRRGDPVVAAAYAGDGATSEGDFHCAMNFAGVWRLPVVFVCQNNQWAITVPVTRQTASETLAIKAAAYGFEGVRVDGNDVEAVYRETARAVTKARSGGGPTLVECLTYRVLSHSTSDDESRYRDRSEVEAWKARDPIAFARARLLERGLLTDDDDARLEADLKTEIDAAIAAAEAATDPPPESLTDGVYATPPWHLRERRPDLPDGP